MDQSEAENRAEIAKVLGPHIVGPDDPLPTRDQIANSIVLMMENLPESDHPAIKASLLEKFSLAWLLRIMITMQGISARERGSDR